MHHVNDVLQNCEGRTQCVPLSTMRFISCLSGRVHRFDPEPEPQKFSKVRTQTRVEDAHSLEGCTCLGLWNCPHILRHCTISVCDRFVTSRDRQYIPKKHGLNQGFLARKPIMSCSCSAAHSLKHTNAKQTISGAGAAQFTADAVSRRCARTKWSTQQPSEAFTTEALTTLKNSNSTRNGCANAADPNVSWNHHGLPQYNNFMSIDL